MRKMKQKVSYFKPSDTTYKRNILRPLSVPLTHEFLKLNWTPNQVTALSGAFALIGIGFILFHQPIYWIVGWAFLFGYGILDSSDGQVARLTGKVSKTGDSLDMLIHTITDSLIFIAIGISLGNMLFGAITSWSMAILHNIHHLKRRVGIKKARVLKSFSTTEMIINSILLAAILELFTGIGFRLIFLTGCGIGFPLILIKKIVWLKNSSGEESLRRLKK